MGAVCANAADPEAAPDGEEPEATEVTVVEALPAISNRHSRLSGISNVPSMPDEDLTGEWRCDANGLELTVALRTDGRLHYARSDSRVALLRPNGHSYVGSELYWNLGAPKKVELRGRGLALEYRRWNKARDTWFAPEVFRQLSPVEAASRGRFVALATLWEALAENHTVLLKGSWLLQQHRDAGVLPRRQELPLGAAWDPTELQTAVEAGSVRIVALSFPWKEREHPDPGGEQLRTVGELIDRRLNYSFPDGTRVLEDLAVFWDYPSLFQKPRTGLEQEAFDWGLLSVNLWYAHSATETWLLTRVPEGIKAQTERRWPFFERALCGLITPADSFLDVGLWEGGGEAWAEVARRCRARREPPLRPEKAAALLKAKTFTSGAEFDKVRRNYERTYFQALCSVRSMDFANLKSWGDKEATALADCLADCPMLEELRLSYDSIGAPGAAALGAAAAKCRRLRSLYLEENPLGDEGAVALFPRLARCPCLERLFLTDTGIGDRGAEALAGALPRYRALRLLVLKRCCISDKGATALGAELAQSATLEELEIDGNQLSAGGKVALKDAWAKAGKERSKCLCG